MGNLKENIYIDNSAIRFNTNLNALEYRSDAGVWLPAAPAATNTPVETVSTVSSNVGPVLVYTVPTTGMYLISSYIVNTVSGTGADSEGQLVINYVDPSGSNAMYASMPSGTNATLVGSSSSPVTLVAGSTVTYTQGSGVYAGGLAMSIGVSVVKI
jgi:hypothetical protein